MEENVIQINGGITINADVSVKNVICEKDYILNPSTCSCKNGKYLTNVMDDLEITFDDVIESCDKETKTILKKFNEKKAICKTPSFYILLAFLLITIVLLIAVSIYYYLIKYNKNKIKTQNKNKIYYHVMTHIVN